LCGAVIQTAKLALSLVVMMGTSQLIVHYKKIDTNDGLMMGVYTTANKKN
jgi:hypothetical protein